MSNGGGQKVVVKSGKTAQESPEESMTRIEKKVEEMSSKHEDLMKLMADKIYGPIETGNEKYEHQSLANLMNIPDDMEYSQDDEQGEFLRSATSQPSTSMARQRKPEVVTRQPVATKTPKVSRKTTSPPRVESNPQITASYIFYRFAFMFIAIFVVPYITAYFRNKSD
ncbi:hypothetical protein CRE_25919 [Caenorhabditis remanei]|uniref:Uncharacterized protein n=1 Tax=Caenorhabditis remanei TaxID=31234 RepID=E3NI42_CAERE|nr:hypothetical protein CRE_25919 [Caenorhabditis remanei]